MNPNKEKTKTDQGQESVAYITLDDMHMMIEALEASYNLDIKEGIERDKEDGDILIPWSRRMRKILKIVIESADESTENFGIRKK